MPVHRHHGEYVLAVHGLGCSASCCADMTTVCPFLWRSVLKPVLLLAPGTRASCICGRSTYPSSEFSWALSLNIVLSKQHSVLGEHQTQPTTCLTEAATASAPTVKFVLSGAVCSIRTTLSPNNAYKCLAICIAAACNCVTRAGMSTVCDCECRPLWYTPAHCEATTQYKSSA